MVTRILPSQPDPGNALIDHALAYAHCGWSVIPTIGKIAAGLWKPFQDRRPDECTLRRMFGRPGITGLAVITGKVSGALAVRDFDKADAYRRWAEANPTMPTSCRLS